MEPSCNNMIGSGVPEGLVSARSGLKNTNPSAVLPSCQHLDAARNGPAWNHPENLLTVRMALSMGLAPHLVFRAVQNRTRTHGCAYVSLKDLVADLFDPAGPPETESREVPMETDQLEEGLMMSAPVVKRALRMGAPPHLIKPLLRAKLLSNGTGYSNTYQLVADVKNK